MPKVVIKVNYGLSQLMRSNIFVLFCVKDVKMKIACLDSSISCGFYLIDICLKFLFPAYGNRKKNPGCSRNLGMRELGKARVKQPPLAL